VPPHLAQAYASLGFESGAFPIAEEIARTVLSLPIGPHLSESEVDHVIRTIRAFCA
jgi:dTDP-4-amino-4,6-dideoxygalactose transaminase